MQSVNGYEQSLTPGKYRVFWGDPDNVNVASLGCNKVEVVELDIDRVVVIDHCPNETPRVAVWRTGDNERLVDAIRVMRDDDKRGLARARLHGNNGNAWLTEDGDIIIGTE